MNKILPFKTITRKLSLNNTDRALFWPKPDYGPSQIHRSNYLNGIRVGAAQYLGNQMSACTIMFKAGSRYEIDDEIGATHFIRAATAVNGIGYSGFIKSSCLFFRDFNVGPIVKVVQFDGLEHPLKYLQQHGGYITCNSDRQTISFTLRCPLPLFRDLKWYLLDAAVRIHFGECAMELHELIPPSPFRLRGTRRRLGFLPYVVDLPTIRTKKFASSFIIRTAKEWNELPADLFPEQYNLGLFKARVNRHFSRCYYREIDLEDFVRPMVKADLDRIPSEQRVIDLVQKAFWAGPLNNSIFCQKERIGGMSQNVLNCYAGTFFKTSRCSFGSVGVPFEETLKLADHIDCGSTERPPDPFQFVSFPRAGYETYDLGPGSETYIAVAVLGTGTSNIPALLTHAIIAEACGTGNVAVGQHAMDRTPHPPLGMLAGDDVCTEFRAFNISYEECGIFGILVKTRSETARQAAFAATQFLANVKDLSCSQIEVGKRRLKVAVALNEDDCVLSSEALALQVANFACMDSAAETINMIDSINAADVSSVAVKLSAQCPRMAVAVVGDVGATPHDCELLCY